MTRKDLIESINFLTESNKNLKKRVSKLEWIIENPPKYKYGDTPFFKKSDLEDDFVFKGTIKSSGEISSYYGMHTRKYLLDTGKEILEIHETLLK